MDNEMPESVKVAFTAHPEAMKIVFNEYDHSGMPDDWLAIAELPLPPTKEGT